MGKASPLLVNHNAGEMSPLMEGRVDVDKYAAGYRSATNFIPLIQGPAERRAGTRFMGEVANSAVKTLLVKFIYAVNQSYDIEFGDHYCRFWQNQGRVDCSNFIAWDNVTAYPIGTLVFKSGSGYYTAIQAVPAGTLVTNTTYWHSCTANALVQAYEIYSPYAAVDLFNSDGSVAIQTEQSADVLYIAGNGTYQPWQLIRYSSLPPRWGFSAYAPIDGPFLDENISNTAIYLTTPAGGYPAGSYNAVATQPLFAATDTASTNISARLLRLDVQTFNTKPWASGDSITTGNLRRAFGNTYQALNTATAGTSPPSHTSGTAWDGASGVLWLYVDSGYGIGTIANFTDSKHIVVTPSKGFTFPADVIGNVSTITAISQANPCVVTAVNTLAVGDPVFITGVVGMTQINDQMYTVTAVTGANFTLGAVNSTGYTAYVSGGTAIGKATLNWRLGAWSQTSGYPTALSFFADRLFWAKGIAWNGSVVNDFASHAIDSFGTVTTDMAVSGVIAANDVNTIVWLAAAQILLIGTQGGEFGLSAITTTNPLGPGNVQVIRQSKQGCKPIRPELVNTTMLYVQRSGKRLLAMDYNFYIDRFESTNQNRLNPQITGKGIVFIAWQAQPYEILWGIRADGVLIGLTFDRQDNIVGWHEHTIGGGGVIESMTIKPSSDGSRDVLTFIIKRTINGITKRYLEYIEKGYETGDTQSSAFYVDCGVTFTSGSPTNSVIIYNIDGPLAPNLITNEHFLQGTTLSILRDGAIEPNTAVATNLGDLTETITTANTGKVFNIGFPAPATITYSRIEAGADVGTSQGKTKRIAQATIRLYNTIGGTIGMDNGILVNIEDNFPSTPMDQPPPISSGDVGPIVFPGDYESDCRITITNNDPVPMTIVGIFPYLETNEPT